MIYLSGVVRAELAARSDTGYLLTPLMGNRPDLCATYWGADTGCFRRPESFDLQDYLSWLSARLENGRRTCLFATAPDRVADWGATLQVALPVLPYIREIGVPAAIVAQDGATPDSVPWDEIDALFMGGSTSYKLSEEAYTLAAEAKRRGKWAHMGRVNSLRRLLAATVAGYDSADGTFLAFGPDANIPRMERWFEALRMQKPLQMRVSSRTLPVSEQGQTVVQ